MSAVERKYALTRVGSGDYLLPSNDAQTIWRIQNYVDGPSYGLMEWPRDRKLWRVLRWTGVAGVGGYVDTAPECDRWAEATTCLSTRRAAVEWALGAGR